MEARKALPFSRQDLERPSSEGRSLHDIVNRFLRSEMKIATPVRELPPLSAIVSAMEKTKIQEFKEFIYDLSSTKIDTILPIGVPPEMNIVGLFWKAATLLTKHPKASPKTTTIHSTVNLGDVGEEGAVVDSSSGTKRKIVDVETVHDSGGKKKGGRKPGGKNWSKREVELLLHFVEEQLPCGRDMWNNVASLCSNTWNGENSWARQGDACKKKFEKLAFMKAPTGTTEVPAEVKKAKQLLLKIEEKERIGLVELNDSDELSDVTDGKKREVALKGARLLDDESKVARRPVTRNATSRDIAGSLDRMSSTQLDATKMLCDALRDIGSHRDENNDLDSEKLKDLETKIESLDEKFATQMKNVNDNLMALISMIQNNKA
mmetsp:Transcript_12680/g.23765  ORF Transcript_12680/g.23765 Transcript_12680/m.23765 type:complete len:377 (-) Transcript_12680:42-1172(-)